MSRKANELLFWEAQSPFGIVKAVQCSNDVFSSHRAELFCQSESLLRFESILFVWVIWEIVMKKSWIVSVLLAGVFCGPSAMALISEFTSPVDDNAKVTVESTVVELTPGIEYLYSYEITSVVNADIGLFSVPFADQYDNPSTVAYLHGSIASLETGLMYWGNVGTSPPLAAQAIFLPSLFGGGVHEFSFQSSYAPTEVVGYVNDAQVGSLYGTLYAPAPESLSVPEPATLLILSIGGLVLRRKNLSYS